MPEKLTSDELGDLAENLFGKLCAQGKLICNKAGRDRAGWDFRVDFPLTVTAGEALDHREPRTCLIQLKATAGETGSVRARLSSMERLAKDKGPAAIVVFRMRPDGTELMGYIVHLLGKDLAKVLRRLRIAERDGRTDVNHLWISFDYRKARRFKIDADGLRAALMELCPADVDDYVAEKRHQLETLGYDDGPGIETEALIYIEDQDHFTRLVSGLAPLKPLRLRSYDRRFGIRVPYKGSLLEELDEFPIDLPRMGPCRVVIRAGALLPPASFECEAQIPFPVAGGPWLVVRHPALTLLFREDGFTMESVGTFNSEGHDLPTWVQLLRGLTYLSQGDATVEFEFQGTRLPGVQTADGLKGPYLDQLPTLLSFVERFQRAIDLAGLPMPSAFALDDIWSAGEMQMSLDMCFNPGSAARFEFDDLGELLSGVEQPALFFNSVTFAERAFTFAVKVQLERRDNGQSFVSTRFNLLDLRPAVADLDDYGALMGERHQLSILIDPGNIILVDADPDQTKGQIGAMTQLSMKADGTGADRIEDVRDRP